MDHLPWRSRHVGAAVVSHYAYLSDEHLIAAARAEANTMTSTALEIELLARFEQQLDERPEIEGVVELIRDYSLPAEEVRDLIEAHPASIADMTALLAFLNDIEVNNRADLEALMSSDAKTLLT